MKSTKIEFFILWCLCSTVPTLSFQLNTARNVPTIEVPIRHVRLYLAPHDIDTHGKESTRDSQNLQVTSEANPLSQYTQHFQNVWEVVQYYATMVLVTLLFLFVPHCMMAHANDQSANLAATPAIQASAYLGETSTVDEVWDIVNNNYIDRTFNGQDWNEVYNKFAKQAEHSNDRQKEAIVTKMVDSLGDRYSRLIDKQLYADIQRFDVIGIGVSLSPNSMGHIMVGSPPIAGSAAEKAGLQEGDIVQAVNGQSTDGQSSLDIFDEIIAGPDSKSVTFSIQRHEGEPVEFDVTMDRKVTSESRNPVYYRLTERRQDGTNVGYIRMSEFNSLLFPKMQEALADLKSQGANAYVLDLRSNTGGAFQSAIATAGLFMQDSVATHVVDGNEAKLTVSTPHVQRIVDQDTPVAIWLNGLSASASELFASSLHDNCRAVTMGGNSYGKGLIQAVYGLKDGGALVLSIAKYVTPTGNEIQGVGIHPDIPGHIPAPQFVPFLGQDTSKVDFQSISKQLDPTMCTVPEVGTSPDKIQQFHMPN